MFAGERDSTASVKQGWHERVERSNTVALASVIHISTKMLAGHWEQSFSMSARSGRIHRKVEHKPSYTPLPSDEAVETQAFPYSHA